MQSTIRKMLFIIIVCSGLAALFWYFPSFHIAPDDPIFIGAIYSCGLFITTVSLLCIPGLSFTIEALILQIILSFPIWSKVWTLLSIYIEYEYFFMELGYIECWLYITAYFLISMLQYERGTAYQAENGKTKRINAPDKLICKHCGEALFPQDVFCNNCQTINPRVKAMLDEHPELHPADYQPIISRDRDCCPHCEAGFSSAGSGPLGLKVGSPIIGCKHCHNFFLVHSYNEWSVSNRSYKRNLMFGDPITITIFLVLAYGYCTGCANYWLYPGLMGLYLGYRFLLFKTVHYEKIQESNLRLARNPEYPQILISMDYGKHMDQTYHSMMRFKPLTLRDIIKDAFHFD